jgi:hypothetical protein
MLAARSASPFMSLPRRSLSVTALTERHATYPIIPSAITASITRPNGWCRISANASFWLPVEPRLPSPAATANPPTIM